MLTPFPSFPDGQPVFCPVVLNLQGFYYTVQQNAVTKEEAGLSSPPVKSAQMGSEAVKMQEGAGLSPSDISAFKTTKNCLTSPRSPASHRDQTHNLKKPEISKRRGCMESVNVAPFSGIQESDRDESDDEKLGRVGWSKQEEEKLIQLVELFGKHWKHISEHLPNRNPKQIRQRYLNYLRADLSNQKWTPEEDARLLELVAIHGHRWKFMEKKMKKRSQNQLKNRYYGHLKKKQMETVKPQVDLVHLQKGSNQAQVPVGCQLKVEEYLPLQIHLNEQ